jgi:spermidine/putrescine transport system substrate-binding protein
MRTDRLLHSLSVVLSLPLAARAEDPDLTVTDWPGFDAEGMYAPYKEKWGQRPTYAFVTSDDETFQKATSGFRADVSHPCAQMVPKYREADLIEPWDVSRIPEFANLMPEFLASPVIQDEAGVWIIPADWGATAIAYNTETVPAAAVTVNEIGYGHANSEGMKAIDPATLEAAGLGPINGPTLPQLPFDLALRDRQLETFEQIKAGF